MACGSGLTTILVLMRHFCQDGGATPEDLRLVAGRQQRDSDSGAGWALHHGRHWNAVMYAGEGYEEAVQALPIAAAEKERLTAFLAVAVIFGRPVHQRDVALR